MWRASHLFREWAAHDAQQESKIEEVFSNHTCYFAYSNLMILFSMVIALGGILYLRSFGTVKEIQPVSEEIKSEMLKTL